MVACSRKALQHPAEVPEFLAEGIRGMTLRCRGSECFLVLAAGCMWDRVSKALQHSELPVLSCHVALACTFKLQKDVMRNPVNLKR